jgi:hypothetical protein
MSHTKHKGLIIFLLSPDMVIRYGVYCLKIDFIPLYIVGRRKIAKRF